MTEPSDESKGRVRKQFAATATAYITSIGHATGDDLRIVVELAQPSPNDHALDIATGGGHTALALAPLVASVTATDLTPEMLSAAHQLAAQRGVSNISFEPADAEQLHFADASFDIVTSRIAPHHFPDPAAFLSEAARVLRPGGRFVLDDNMPPDEPELADFMNRFEAWRDPSHVRALTRNEWLSLIQDSGLKPAKTTELAFKRHPFGPWTERAQMPLEERARLAHWLLHEAPKRCREYFRVEAGEGPDPRNGVESISATWAVIAAVKPLTWQPDARSS